MDYSSIFDKYLIVSYASYLFVIVWVIFLLKSDVPFDSNEKIRNSINYNSIKFSIRIAVLIFIIYYSFYSFSPIVKDTSDCLKEKYAVTQGIVYQKVINEGMYGLFKSVKVIVDGEIISYRVLWAEDNIYEGEQIKVTFLSNTKWAVVEKVDW